jgi:hypothetical protein
VRRLVLVGLLGGALLALGGCASQGYGSGGAGFDEYYDDCYDGYCMGYDAYGRVYERPKAPVTVARGDVDRVDRSHGTPQTVIRGAATRPTVSSPSFGRMTASPPPPPPPPATAAPR